MFSILFTYFLLITTLSSAEAKSVWSGRRSRNAPRPPAVAHRRNITELVEARALTHTISKRDVDGWAFSGCVNDGPARALPEYYAAYGDNSVDKCITTCASKGFVIAGMQYGTQCWCGNSLQNGLGTGSYPNDCVNPCPGNTAQKCGGSYRLSLYRKTVAPTITLSPLGCFSDSGSSRTLNAASVSSDNMNPQNCANWCGARGYKFGGVEFSKECYCGNSYDASRKLADGRCNYGCSAGDGTTCGGYGTINVFSISGGASSSPSPSSSSATTTSASATTTSSAPTTSASLGCYSDSGSSRSLTGPSRSDGANTPQVCMAWCASQGYLYAGVEYSKECYCGNSVPAARKIDNNKCNYGCAGSSTSPCGGYGTMNIYGPLVVASASATTTSVSATTTSAAPTSSVGVISPLGCYQDGSTRTLNGASRKDYALTPSSCTTWCGSQGFSYAGMQYGNECYCGNTLPAAQKIPENRCTYACSGDASFPCGAYYILNVWSVPDCGGIVTTRCKVNGGSSSSSSSSTSSPTPTVSGTCNAACTGVKGVPAAPASTGTKYLYAHHMVGNTYSYTPATWADDINLASGAGIDGFALNFGSADWQFNRMDDAYAAAKAKGNFKMFLSFDVTAISCGSASDAQRYADLIVKGAKTGAQAMYKNKVLVSTFAGHECQFGQGNPTAGWNYVRQLVTNGGYSMYLVPAIFTDISNFKNMPWFDGEFNWDSAWPTGSAKAQDLTTASDLAYMDALDGRGYMAGVSPAFFTYYSPSSWNKNWIYRGDGWLLARRMEQMVQLRNQLDLAEIISWNDYGESHYIGPIRQDQPDSQGWTNGMPHTAWLSLIQYYAPAFKTGTYPTPSTDSLWLWTRPHPKAANPTNPSMGRPTNWEVTDDNLYAVVVLTSPAIVTITSGSNSGQWSLAAGVNKLSVASAPGVITGRISRNNAVLKSYDSTGSFTYTNTPRDYNYNYFVASI